MSYLCTWFRRNCIQVDRYTRSCPHC